MSSINRKIFAQKATWVTNADLMASAAAAAAAAALRLARQILVRQLLQQTAALSQILELHFSSEDLDCSLLATPPVLATPGVT